MSFYKVTEWGPGLYRITSPECVHMDLVVGAERALLIDTGWGLGPLQETVRGITDKPLIVANTHGHIDHVNGNPQFEGPVYIHPKDVELCKVHSSSQMRSFILMTTREKGILTDDFDEGAFLAEKDIAFCPVEEGYMFDLGGKTLEVIELPGHTAGSIGFLYREEKILYVGDAINGALLLSGPEAAPLSVYIQTLEKAKKLAFDKMVQSHVEQVFNKDVLDTYLDLAKSVDWDKAVPYKNEEGKENPDVRVMCTGGKTQADAQDPNFACIVISKDKL